MSVMHVVSQRMFGHSEAFAYFSASVCGPAGEVTPAASEFTLLLLRFSSFPPTDMLLVSECLDALAAFKLKRFSLS